MQRYISGEEIQRAYNVAEGFCASLNKHDSEIDLVIINHEEIHFEIAGIYAGSLWRKSLDGAFIVSTEKDLSYAAIQVVSNESLLPILVGPGEVGKLPPMDLLADFENFAMPICMDKPLSELHDFGEGLLTKKSPPCQHFVLPADTLRKKFTNPKLGKPWQKKGRH